MFTTSRYASKETRELARRLAEESGEIFISRGKRTVSQLADLARRKGEEKVNIVEEKDGEPSSIATIAIKETGEWEWIGERPIHKDKKA